MDPTTPFNQRLLTEAVRQLEIQRGQPFDEPAAKAAGQTANGDLEQRLIARAMALECTPALRAALQQWNRMLTLGAGLLLLLAVLSGAGAARLAFGTGPEHAINVYGLLTVLLALPLFLLLLWLLLLAVPRTTGRSSLGALAFAFGRWLSSRLHPSDTLLMAAAQARSRLLVPAGGYWLLSSLSHALWLAYLVGALGVTLVLLSIRQYGFVWETTILSAEDYVALTRALALLPEWFGFAAPDADQIAASRWRNSVAVGNATAWSGFVVGCLFVYGVLPRLLLVPCCLLLYRRAREQFRLDTTLPGYARFQDTLQPLSASLGVIDPHTETPLPATETPSVQAAIVMLETDPPSEWPPALGHDWLDLGAVDDRRSRDRVLECLCTTTPPPDALVIVCSLAMTPDRGMGRTLAQLIEDIPKPLLLLSEGQRLRQRESRDDAVQRIADWHRLAAHAGLGEDHVLELDLNHLTDASRARLAERLGLHYQPATVQGPRIDAACALIVEHVERWRQFPDATEQAELQRAIARLHGHRREAFQLPLPTLDPAHGPLRQQLQHGAEWVRQLLPPGLRANPRWLATGALSGALGCVALATLTAPAALAALPLWSSMAAALTLFINPQKPRSTPDQTPELGEPVAAATLFMLLLELQGRPEADITHALDRLLDPAPPEIGNSDDARRWLNAVQRRYTQWREYNAREHNT